MDRMDPKYRWPSRSLRRIRRFGRRVETEEPDTPGNVRTAFIAMLIATVLMALFGSGELRSWARDLPPNSLTDAMVLRADEWDELMYELGPARWREAVRDLFERFRQTPW